MRTCFLGIDIQYGLVSPSTEHVVKEVVDLMSDNDWATVWATQRVLADEDGGIPEDSPEARLVAVWAFWPTRTITRTQADLPEDACKALLDKRFDRIVLAGLGSGVAAIETQLRERGLPVERANGACVSA